MIAMHSKVLDSISNVKAQVHREIGHHLQDDNEQQKTHETGCSSANPALKRLSTGINA
jgi:hypothetical protein